MATVVLVVLAVAGAWALVSVSVAFLAGGVIHARDHRDLPAGGVTGSPDPGSSNGVAAPSDVRAVARLLPARPVR